MPKQCLINFAKGGWYTAGQERLIQSVREVGFDGDILAFKDEAELPGCPTHQAAPYAFKPYALREARRRGYEVVLWADASVWAIRPLAPVFEHITKHGHLFFYNGWCDTWTSDACMKAFGMCRAQLKITPHLMGICMGWDLRTPKCQVFLDRWFAKANDGVSFFGSWTNANHEVSHDEGVKGHRHDQAVASVLAWQLDMPTIIAHETLFQYFQNPQGTTFMQNPTYEMIKPGICLVAQGM
jgi:hypothetical protein